MWQKVTPLRKRSKVVKITPQKVEGKVRGLILLIPPEAWLGEPPKGFDILVDTETLSLRVQEGDSYSGKLAPETRRCRISCMQALTALGIPAPAAAIRPPFKWHDGGLEIDLSQWRRE